MKIVRRATQGAALAMCAACAALPPHAAENQPSTNVRSFDDHDALEVELMVARDLLMHYPAGRVSIDSMYAVPGHAPGHPSREMRPRARTRSLRDSLNRQPGADNEFVLRLSKLDSRNSRIQITATIEYPAPWQPGRRGYETVQYGLEHGAHGWAIRDRAQLGIT